MLEIKPDEIKAEQKYINHYHYMNQLDSSSDLDKRKWSGQLSAIAVWKSHNLFMGVSS